MNTGNNIVWGNGRITFPQNPSPAAIRPMARAFHVVCEKQGYQEVSLDFSSCETLFESFMLPLVAISQLYIRNGVDFKLLLPSGHQLRSLFHNSNWAHLISPRHYDPTTYEGKHHVPAIHYQNGQTQHRAVDSIIDAVLSSLTNLNRGSLKALEWSLNEITDNVLNHSSSSVGGFVQASTFSGRNVVEFVVADTGIGIPESLRMSDHKRALEEAIKEGVTRDKNTNAGNGLFGSYQIATISGGQFHIHSGHASLLANAGETLRIIEDKAFFRGAVVVVRIDCSAEHLLEKALRFGGQPHDPPYDYIERRFEGGEPDEITIKLREETDSFGSREVGRLVKNKIDNIMTTSRVRRLVVDFDGVFIISSSFADEVFGRMFAEMGPMDFMTKIEFKNVDSTVRSLIDRAIFQRAANPGQNGASK
jgi:hypothetical protein